ncbi:hypothetical protein Ae706Ps2_3287 [Pseudonocardia sp. Ae706_Ps2]|nr:hypothetical protein Ae331Ps2_2635c [Pseudonocardia sp. Ae331_Ps2]OLM11815.1 hypothetical protein Ae505Ps2_1940c [Pseudonocardia sp. Ae505_Ps2]OLM24854.1 hypothetical protein Ae706Ps2_3287 [Pseudonocardia sp. Ae706_Ps2]
MDATPTEDERGMNRVGDRVDLHHTFDGTWSPVVER